MQPSVTLSLLIKRNLQFLNRASTESGCEPTFVRLLDRRFSLLSYSGLIKEIGVSHTSYTKMLVNFGIFDRVQYFQGPKLTLLELLETLKVMYLIQFIGK